MYYNLCWSPLASQFLANFCHIPSFYAEIPDFYTNIFIFGFHCAINVCWRFSIVCL